ncbi:MAG: adenylate/guanylate cyclase domain-containing protein [Actinomycetota bacterium]
MADEKAEKAKKKLAAAKSKNAAMTKATKAKAKVAVAKEEARAAKRESGRRAVSAIHEAIRTALGQDTELAEEMEDAQRRAGGKRTAAAWLHAADALEPVLADAVEKRPSFLGRLAYGTAQLVSALATDDAASSSRFAEIAGGDHVGIVFIDVVGFTAYTASNGDDAAVALVKRLETMVSSICNLHDGEVVKHLGDGFLLAFGSAADAVRAALALRDAARKKRAADPSFQQVRIAVHAGRPSVLREDLIGHDVNLTARLLEHCEPGEVLATAEAKELASKVDDAIRFLDAGEVEARGVPEPIATFRAGV